MNTPAFGLHPRSPHGYQVLGTRSLSLLTARAPEDSDGLNPENRGPRRDLGSVCQWMAKPRFSLENGRECERGRERCVEETIAQRKYLYTITHVGNFYVGEEVGFSCASLELVCTRHLQRGKQTRRQALATKRAHPKSAG